MFCMKHLFSEVESWLWGLCDDSNKGNIHSRSIMCSLLLWAHYVPTGFWGNYIKAIINIFLQRTNCIVRATDITFVCYTIFNYSNSRLLQHLWFAIFFLCSSDSAKVLTVSSAALILRWRFMRDAASNQFRTTKPSYQSFIFFSMFLFVFLCQTHEYKIYCA